VEREWSIMYNNSQYSMYGVLAFSDSDIFSVGVYADENNNKSAGILHYDGVAWTPMSLSNLSLQDVCLNSVWGSSPNDVFAIGNNATVIHYDGIMWSNSNYYDENLYDVTGIWGSSAKDIYITLRYSIMHYDGVDWKIAYIDYSGTSWFKNIWGTSENDIFAINQAGFIYHFDGTDWTTLNNGSTEDLYSIGGTSHYDIFVSGNNGAILHYNGNEWSNMFSGTDLAITGIYNTSSTDVYAAVYTSILHYDGNQWTVMSTPNNESQWIESICASPSGMIYAVGNGIIMRYEPIFPLFNFSIAKNASLDPVSGGTIMNNAPIFANEYDPNSINNSVIENTALNPPPTSEELIIALKLKINKLISEGQHGKVLGNSLIVMLDTAMKQINKNNKKTAKNQLNAFINQVNTFIINGNISRKNGKLLIDATFKIMGTL